MTLKCTSALCSLATAVHAIPVLLDTGSQPSPAKSELITALSQASDSDTAADALLIHYNYHGYPAVGVEVEDRNGKRHASVEVARFGNIWLSEAPEKTKKAAIRHFSDLSNTYVNSDVLTSRLDGFQANPLHHVVSRLQPSSDGSEVNALLKIEQSKPHEFSLGYHDSGASPLPRERVWFQTQVADLWNTSSLGTTRLTLAPDPDEFHAIQLGSRFFNPAGRELGFTFAYSGSKDTGTNAFDAYTFQAAAHWRSEKIRLDNWRLWNQIGLAYRRTNNALEFGDSSSKGLADVIQIITSQNWELRNKKNLTRISGSLVFSPGGLSSDGDDEGHDSLRPGAQSEYVLARLNLWHRHNLPKGWDIVANLGGQWASDPVLQGDQIALGGASGVRGLPEQFALGDHGIISGIELRTPVIPAPNNWLIRPSAFVQAGKTFDLHLDDDTSALTSGVGLQIGWKDSLRASAHAGWRLDEGGNELHTQLTWKF